MFEDIPLKMNLDIINSLKNSTSKGNDNITTSIVKECKIRINTVC